MQQPVSITSSTAIASLVSGILAWIMLPVVGAIVAVICGHVARAEIRRMPPGSIEGDGMAVAGLVLGWLQLGLALLGVLLLLTVLGAAFNFSGWRF
ncbi:MAG: DUF4190 domain-containing protein [Dokdonella sp.]